MTPVFAFFGTTINLLLLAAIVLAVLAVINRKAVSTFFYNIRSYLGGAARAMDSRNAVNNMKQSVDDAKAEIQGHVVKLNQSQGQIDSLTRDVTTYKSEENQLIGMIRERATEVNGDENDAVLQDLATQLANVRQNLADRTADLTEQTTLHNQVLAQVKDAVLRADNLEKQADRLGVKLDMSESRAQLATVGLNFQKSGAQSSLSDAERYQQEIQKQIDANNGAVKVAQQLAPTGSGAATATWQAQRNAKSILKDLGVTKPTE